MFMITIENLLRFIEYLDDKIISMKNFPLGFVKVRSTHLSFVFLQKFSSIFNHVRWPAIESSTFQVPSFTKCYTPYS